MRHAVPPEPGDRQVSAAWSTLPFTHPIDPSALAGVDATYELRIEGTSALLRIHGGRAEVLPEGSDAPDVVISTDAGTMAAVGAGRRTIGDAIDDGAITVEGDLRAADALTVAFDPVGKVGPGGSGAPGGQRRLN